MSEEEELQKSIQLIEKLDNEKHSELETEFKKYMNIIDPKNCFERYQIKDIDESEIENYGELAIAVIDFGFLRVIKYHKDYENTGLADCVRHGFEYQIYECVTIGNGYTEPPDYEENLIESKESGLQAFMYVLHYLIEECLNSCLMAMDIEEEQLRAMEE